MTSNNGPIRSRRRSRHPYRDTAIFYGILAGTVIGVALLTGGRVFMSIFLGGAAFLVATGWSWWRLRTRTNQRP